MSRIVIVISIDNRHKPIDLNWYVIHTKLNENSLIDSKVIRRQERCHDTLDQSFSYK
jgi:hypothetical protein